MKKKVKYPNIEKCDPRTCISGNMMKSNRIIANVFRKHLKPFGITDSQLSMLFFITKAKNVSQKQIAERLFLEKSTVNRNITRLMDQQYLSTDSNKIINTTEKGKQLLEKVIPRWNIAMKEIQSILGKEGVQAVNLILGKLNH